MSTISPNTAHKNLTVLLEALRADSGLLSLDRSGEEVLVIATKEPSPMDRTISYVNDFFLTVASSTLCKFVIWDPKKQI